MNPKNRFRPATILASILVALLTTSVNAAQGPGPAAPTVAKSLIAKEKFSWTLAIKKNAPTYRALHASDFLTVSGIGVQGRAPSEASALDANVTFDKCNLSHMDLHWMSPDVALITYHVRFAGIDHGKRFAGDQYASSLWVRRGKEWLNTFYQATDASKE